MRRAPRRLTVLASLDVAGFTRLVADDERGTLIALARLRRQVLRPTLARYSGNLFKTMGDGALVEFPSVEDAAEWAIAFQTRMAEENASRDPPVTVRVRVALADVFVEGNDRFGAAVGFVVRLQQAAEPGGIAITHSARWQLVKALAAQFDRTAWAQFKNMDEQFEIWLWRRPGDTAAANVPAAGIAHRPLGSVSSSIRIAEIRQEPELVPQSSERPSIAVLAFDNMSGDAQAGSIADGIVEEITATLSRIRDFTVIARNSAYSYKGQARDIRAISRELGVRYVLEGSLQKAGNRIRITAQLIDAASGTHLWADRYEGLVDYLFDFEDEIAERVAGALHPSILAAEIALPSASARRTSPPTIWC
jgi:adenylate cyclase